MTENVETAVAVLQVQMAAALRDFEKLEAMAEARHAETMARLAALSSEMSAAREFSRGQRSAVSAMWAAVGSLVTGAVAWFLWGRP